jgi:hypothetical protein
MQVKKILAPIGAVLLMLVAYRAYGWSGVALAAGGLVMWLLLHFNRMLMVFKRAANSPVGYVGSTVMLQAKLKPGMPLLHVVALTRSLGEQLSAPATQPEQFRWTDPSEATVTCEFLHGKLVRWDFRRPAADEAPAAPQSGAGPAS